jgi:hypothetical protein
MTVKQNEEAAQSNKESAESNKESAEENRCSAYANTELLGSIKTFFVRFGIVLVIMLGIIGITSSILLSRQSETLDRVEQNVNANTTNVNKFGEDVRATRRTLEEALRQVQAGRDPDLVTNINKGLDQIDKICEQTNCEG